MTASKADACVSALVPDIEHELSKRLQAMPHDRIKSLGDRERKAIVQEVYEKVTIRMRIF